MGLQLSPVAEKNLTVPARLREYVGLQREQMKKKKKRLEIFSGVFQDFFL